MRDWSSLGAIPQSLRRKHGLNLTHTRLSVQRNLLAGKLKLREAACRAGGKDGTIYCQFKHVYRDPT